MRTLTRLGAAAAAAVLAVGGAVVVTAAPAMAAPTIKVSPAGPYKGGDKVEVTLAGFTANAPVAVGLIPASRFPAEGPGDACASKLGCSALLVADASGGVKKTLTIVEGPIQNSKAPAETCGPKNDCVIGAANINDPKETVKAEIEYVQPAATKTTTTEKSATTSGGGSATKTTTTTTSVDSGADSAADTGTLPKTGPTETLVIGLLGLAVFQLGLIVAVRAFRSSPRRMSA
jgi:LPXTG-motif cell wall-anchored protein